nr:zinc finger protein 1035 isoform X3 [Doryrhamphus excisus]
MMLGLQGNTSPSKTHRCVACSATFNGLAALLVHQATHANTLPKISTPPLTETDISPPATVTASQNSSSDPLQSPPVSCFICDCGEEFQNFCLMLEHKQLHAAQAQQPPTAIPSSTERSNNGPTNQNETLSPKTELVQSFPSTSGSPQVQKEHKENEILQDGDTFPASPSQTCTITPEDGQHEHASVTSEKISAIENESQDLDKSLFCGKEEKLAKNDKIMKMVASAYMGCNSMSMSLSPNENKSNNIITLKQEAVPVDITPVQEPEPEPEPTPEPINDLSVAKLRRLLAKPGIKTRAPTISSIIDSSRKKIVSLTKVLSPVVVLETRQMLRDSSNTGLYGKYQCGRCRRTFPNSDRLTEHHFLHKKERIKCCRRCKQLIIGKLPFTDNHVCTPSGKMPVQLSNTLPLAPKIMPFHSLNNTKKSFFCPVCKHNYARRYNLKKHKCQGPKAPPIQISRGTADRMLALRSSCKPLDDHVRNVAVGTEIPGRIKVEVTSTTSEQFDISEMAWCGFSKSYPPFMPKSAMKEDNSLDAESAHHDGSNEGKWTMPLDDETELQNVCNDNNTPEEAFDSDAVANLSYFVRDGIKRYPCHRCQKTYSRPSTLSRHLRLCGFRPRGPGTVSQSGSQGAASQNSVTRPLFACFVCGKNFNRKDNMMVHRRKCQLQQANRELLQRSLSGGAKDGADNDANNWGIMSLPSVLPRRVTCECGVGFTSPRLLLEHLQKHAQESYTCPTCGETVSSWGDYEVHLQIHMHPHHQLLKGIPTQRSQPFVLRIQQQQQQKPPAPPPPPVNQPPQKQQSPTRANLSKKRTVCTRCGNSFATRCSLRRHIAWNRCKGGRAQNAPKTYRCSRCNSEFPNMVSLLFHQRSGACKPAIKPVRCPVCLRWFGTVDTLQRHLLTHKQSESQRCDICHGTYPNLKSLKNHRRRVHHIMAANVTLESQELMT